MSLPNLKIKCKGCNFKQIILPIPVDCYYKFYDGETIPAYRTIAWCYNCNKIVGAEKLPSAKDIALQIIENKNMEMDFEFKRTLQWISERKSPPRCLKCGSIDITYISFDFEANNSEKHIIGLGFRHECGGQFFSYDYAEEGEIRFMFVTQKALIDPEGLVLESKVEL